MKPRLPDVPAIKSQPFVITAPHFNRVRLALSRLGSPLRFIVPSMRGFEVYLDRDLWVCLDRNLNHRPMLAWTNFQTVPRNSLTAPVRCDVYHYHAYANVIIKTLLDEIDAKLAQRLASRRRFRSGKVVYLSRFRHPW